MAQKVLYNDSGRVKEIALSSSSVDLGNVTNDLQIPKSIVTTKGDIITATDNATPVRQGVGSNGQIIVGDSNLTNGLGYKDPSFRNWVINGNFDIAQRGTSWTISSSSSYGSIYCLDKFSVDWNNMGAGTFPNIVVSKQPLASGAVPNSFNHLRFAWDGVGSDFNASSFCRLDQYIENGTRYLCGLGKKITLSFYAKSSFSGKRIFGFPVQLYGSGGSPSSDENLSLFSATLSTEWTRYSFTLPTNTLVGKTFGTNNDDCLLLVFYIHNGLVDGPFSFGTIGSFDIAQVQLVAGDVALPFEPKPFAEELRDCQRYYEKSYAYETYAGASTWVNSLGFSGAGGNCSIGDYMAYWGHYKVPKRISATPIIYDQSGNIGKVNLTKYDGNADLNSTASVLYPTREGFCVVTQSTSVAQRGMYFHYICDADF